MSTLTKEIIYMLDMLPQSEQEFAYELVRKLVLAWDPDFTKLTPSEAEQLKAAKEQIKAGDYYTADTINFENMDNLKLD